MTVLAPSPVSDFFALLERASRLIGPSRAMAYDRLTTLAGPALQSVAEVEFPNAVSLTFGTNFTDEGTCLYMTGYRLADGTWKQAEHCIDAEIVNNIVFSVSGSGETGSNIHGMTPTSPSNYELVIQHNL